MAVISNAEYERIKKNARISVGEEYKNQEKILRQQKSCLDVKARAHIAKIKEIDKNKTFYPLIKDNTLNLTENSILYAAKRAKDDSLDEAKRMEQILKYAKVASIRELQIREHEKMDKDFKDKENKIDLMMELERLKEIKYQEDREAEKRVKRVQSAKIIINQIKDNEVRRLQEREMKIREGELIKKQIREMQEKEERNEENRKMENLRLAKEIDKINKITQFNKEKKKLLEKEEDLNRLKYNMERAKKEEEEIAERKRIQEQKEKETQKLREKQEKFADKQALMDELRANRAYEEAEKKARQKELDDIKRLLQQRKELMEGNELQKKQKREQMQQYALDEKKEYDNIIKRQIANMEEERKQDEIRRNLYKKNGQEILRQIKEKVERKKVIQRGIFQEGILIKQELENFNKNLERIRKQKLDEMEKYNINPKYRVDLERFKIK